MTDENTTQDHGKNDHRFDDLLNKVKQLGTHNAVGNDALAKMAMVLAQGAQDGVLDTTRNKHGKGVDDAKKIFEGYVEAFSSKNIFDMTTNSIAANTSKFRVIIQAGMSVNHDITTTFNRGHLKRKELVGQDVKVKGAFNVFVDMARALIREARNGADLTDEEIAEIVAKPEPSPKTVREEIVTMQKKAEKLITTCSCQEPELIQAEEFMRELLKKV